MKSEIQLSTSLFQQVQLHVKRTIKNPDIQAIHNLRITLRRLQAWRSLYKDRLESADARRLRDDLRAGLKLAGHVRDLDISAKLLHRFGYRKVDAKLKAERLAGGSSLVTFLMEHGPFVCPSLRLPATSASVSTVSLSRYVRLGDWVGRKGSTAKQLHRFRIEAKKVRYMLEFVPSKGNTERLQKISKVQRLLGDINDCRIALGILKKLGNDRRVKRKLKKRQGQKTRAFREGWPELQLNASSE